MTKITSRLCLFGLTGSILFAAACSAQSAAERAGTRSAATSGASAAPVTATPRTSGTGPATVVWLGDSIAVQEAIPLAAAFTASHVRFQSIAEVGGGNVVGPLSAMNWKTLPAQIAAAGPTVLAYQITTYDWGSRQQQQQAYERLLSTVTKVRAKLVFVTMPPIKPDSFYQPHMAELDRAASMAQTVAAGSGGEAIVLNADAVWGSTYQQDRNGTPDRSSDGIHTCPQGAARFTNWLIRALAAVSPGFTPAPAQSWANTGWSASGDFHGC